jgi:hypothetical protein
MRASGAEERRSAGTADELAAEEAQPLRRAVAHQRRVEDIDYRASRG